MHESPVTQEVLRTVIAVAQRHGGARVTKVRLEVGSLSGFNPDSMAAHFALAAQGTVAADATVDCRTVEPSAHCRVCRSHVDGGALSVRCARCGSPRDGRDVRVVDIEIED